MSLLVQASLVGSGLPAQRRTQKPQESHSVVLQLETYWFTELKTVKRNIDLSKLDEKEDDEDIDPETGLPKKSADGEEDLEEEELEDEEDDEGNDYGESYFDNGENDVDLDGRHWH
ncbi:hypothetical protein BGZ65_012730 [Modicella reniformis]|uniref:Uncharacterized protein n=1 Tax=Modicella reniformis TaxID=1440133 RepID=A0A9P6SUM3_9FUNG|nr:hypothetical protein BGZ65_012730 [Modicella reniformis]